MQNSNLLGRQEVLILGAKGGYIAALIAHIVGPEGGFDKTEIQYAKNIGANSVSLGKRILRSDTATTAALFAIQSFVEH